MTFERAVDTSRVPPHDPDAEGALLGAMLLSGDATSVAVTMVTSGDFYEPAHSRIFAAMTVLHKRGQSIDAVTVTDVLRRSGESVDPSIFVSLQANTPSIANARHYAEIVAKLSQHRQVIEAGQSLVDAGYRRDVDRQGDIIAGLSTGRLPEDGGGLLRRWTMKEVIAEPFNFRWLMRGFIARPTYGQMAGELKTLKTIISMFLIVAMATGLPMFDQFVPERPEPVLVYVGEGGRELWARRMARICSAMGVSPGDLDVHPIFDVKPIASPVFQATLQRDLHEVKPGLVVPDPLYAYHGTDTSAMHLHEEGALLNLLSAPCVDAGASLLVVNHMNQTGYGRNLKRITGAGSGEWADSWVLLEHRQDPDVAAGEFMLTMDVGSRQWGGQTWELDLNLGRFNENSGQHEGEITWNLARASATSDRKEQGGATGSAACDRARGAIVNALVASPWQLTMSEVRKALPGAREGFVAAWNGLVDDGEIVSDRLPHTEGRRTVTRDLWALCGTRAEPGRNSSAHLQPKRPRSDAQPGG